jgi:hypothetical protein
MNRVELVSENTTPCFLENLVDIGFSDILLMEKRALVKSCYVFFFCAAAPSAARSIASFAFAGVVSKNISIDSASVSWVESPHRSPLHHLCRELRRRIDVFVFAIYVLLPRRKLRRSRRLLLPPGKEQKLFEAKARHFPITLLSLSHAT